MELKYIETFVAVTRHGSFSEAGKSLGLSRSGISIRISALEEELGHPLFDRDSRPPKLTREGRILLDQAREMMSVWGRMTGRLKRPEETGLLSIGAVQTVLTGLLPFALADFRRRCPDVRLSIRTGLADELDAMVRRGELDAAVQPQSDNIHPGLTWQTICREELVVVAPAAMAGSTDAELLAAAPLVRYRRIAWGLGRTIEQEFARRGLDVPTLAEVDALEAALNLVRNGLGVAILPRRRMPDPFLPGIRHVPFGTPPLARTLGVLWREDIAVSALVRELCDSLSGAAEAFA